MNPLGCLMLFLLPFAAVGVFAGVQVVRAALMHDWAHAGFYAIFALTFGGVGFGGSPRRSRERRSSPHRRR